VPVLSCAGNVVSAPYNRFPESMGRPDTVLPDALSQTKSTAGPASSGTLQTVVIFSWPPVKWLPLWIDWTPP
jgi:hypothetical protein